MKVLRLLFSSLNISVIYVSFLVFKTIQVVSYKLCKLYSLCTSKVK